MRVQSIHADLDLKWYPKTPTAGTLAEVTVTFDTARRFAPPPTDPLLSVQFHGPGDSILWDLKIPVIPTMTGWKPSRRYRFTEPVWIPESAATGEIPVTAGYLCAGGETYYMQTGTGGHLRLKLDPIRIAESLPLAGHGHWKITRIRGCHATETEPDGTSAFFWIGSEAVLMFPNPLRDVRMYIECSCPLPLESWLDISIGKTAIDRIALGDFPSRRLYHLPSAFLGTDPELFLMLNAGRTVVPVLSGLGEDTRELGARIYRVEVVPD
ncbi:hypothetical protein JXA40_11350 [bacterium]|nr:hypothetical protein [candidate division CSSED10-310 bacterium]